MSQLPLCGSAITAPLPSASAASRFSTPVIDAATLPLTPLWSITGSRKVSCQYRAYERIARRVSSSISTGSACGTTRARLARSCRTPSPSRRTARSAPSEKTVPPNPAGSQPASRQPAA